jgi:hypothetical protein
MMTLLIMYLIGGVVLCALSIPLIAGKIGPNGLYGFRVQATLQNATLWFKVNRYAGKRLLVTGILTVLATLGFYFLPGIGVDAYALACLAVFSLAFTIAIVQSILYLRSAQKS